MITRALSLPAAFGLLAACNSVTPEIALTPDQIRKWGQDLGYYEGQQVFCRADDVGTGQALLDEIVDQLTAADMELLLQSYAEAKDELTSAPRDEAEYICTPEMFGDFRQRYDTIAAQLTQPKRELE